MAALDVDVLACPSCGKPAAWDGVAARATCAACGAEVDVPEAHRAAREVERAHADLDASAREAAARLGAPPSPWLRPFVIFESSCAFVVLLPLLAVFALGISVSLVRALAPQHAHDDRYAVFGAFVGMVITWGAGLSVATYAGRRAAGLRTLQAGLAAKPPARPGGPAACRHCGAPLTVSRGERGVRCRHCGVENLVGVDAAWLRGARRAEKELAGSLVDAERAHRGELARLTKSLRARLIGVGVVGVPLLGVLGAMILGSPAAPPSTPATRLAEATVVPRLVIDRDYVPAKTSDVSLAPILAPGPCDAPTRDRTFHYSPVGCSEAEGKCHTVWYVALRQGDAVRLETQSAEASLAVWYPMRGEPPFSSAQRGERVARGWVKAGEPVAFEAPADGWYLLLYALEGASPEQEQDLCAALERR